MNPSRTMRIFPAMSLPRARWVAAGIALALVFTTAFASAAHFTLGEHAALPGGNVIVPVTMDAATGLASLQMTVNFNPEFLTFVSATNGPVGADMAVEWFAQDGRLKFAAVRSQAGILSTGDLARLTFQINSGAIAGMTAPLAIAEVSAGGTFAEDLAWQSPSTHADGVVRVVDNLTDTDGNGLPDWWEESRFGKPTGANPQADDDGDGMSNLQEFRAGTNPTDPMDNLRVGIQIVSGNGVSLSVATVAGRNYQFEYSVDLVSWHSTGPVVAGTGGQVEMAAGNASQSGVRYFRVEVWP